MPDVFRIAGAFVDHVGAGRAADIGISFIMDGIGYDFWPELASVYGRRPSGADGRARLLQDAIDRIVDENDPRMVLQFSEALVSETRAFLVSFQERHPHPEPFREVFGGYDEEAKSLFNKIIRACEKGDRRTAYLVAARLQWEVGAFLARAAKGVRYSDVNLYSEARSSFVEAGLPDLAASMRPMDLEALRRSAAELDRQWQALLRANGIPIQSFGTIGELAEYLDQRGTGGWGRR